MFAAALLTAKHRKPPPQLPRSDRRAVGERRRRRAGARLARISIVAGLAAVLLAGCTTLSAPEDDLAAKIESYYAAHALEEGGACPTPEIASMTRRKVQASTADRTVLRVRYSYFDPSQDSTPAWSTVLLAARACTGFAERDFTFERAKLGYRVVGMSGPTREPVSQ